MAEIAALGRARIRDIYSKNVQWTQFGDLVGRL
jgi:hypothetical protein